MPLQEHLKKRQDPFAETDAAGTAHREALVEGSPNHGPSAGPSGQSSQAAAATMGHWAEQALAEDAARSAGHDKKKDDAAADGHGADKDAAKKAGTSKIVEIGGEIYAAGHRSDGKPWRVAIEEPIEDLAAAIARTVESQRLRIERVQQACAEPRTVKRPPA